jgi:prophage antirepressor-like protein
MINDEPWFVAKDVCAVLGYSNARDAAAKHLLPGQTLVSRFATRAGARMLSVLNEDGLYRLIMRSDLPGAARFQSWVTGEVLPSIRKTGSYGTAPALPQTYADALRELAGVAKAQVVTLRETRRSDPIPS